ncbi:MAG: class I SAM-dependent methyltransferase [Flavobacteriales bacterium]|nr:class I SAM-dependent methyltransferase [Flavobacteriales bacterium]
MSDKKFPYKISETEPTDWFEELYNDANVSGKGVPWATMDTHTLFKKWLETNKLDGKGKTALVVGCGMGDDAITLEKMGFEVTAFDVSGKAIEYCQERFKDSTVKFVTADLLKEIPEWSRQFDFVLEIYTIQALPPKYEHQVIEQIGLMDIY